jgi:hypothetical protein
MTTFGLPDTSTYTTIEFVSCLVTPPARAYGSQVRFHPLRIRHQSARSSPGSAADPARRRARSNRCVGLVGKPPSDTRTQRRESPILRTMPRISKVHRILRDQLSADSAYLLLRATAAQAPWFVDASAPLRRSRSCVGASLRSAFRPVRPRSDPRTSPRRGPPARPTR